MNNLLHENKFEDQVKNISNFSIMQNISFLSKNIYFFYSWKSIFLKILRIQSAFAGADTTETQICLGKTLGILNVDG